MNTRNNIKGLLIVFCAMFVVLSIYLVYTVDQYGTRWFSSPYNTRLNTQKNNAVAGDILDRNGTMLATTDSDGDRVYTDDSSVRRATSHVVGDNYGQTFGAENFFSKYLLGFDQSIFERITGALSGKPVIGSDVVLTIDAKLSDAAYDAMNDYRGAVVVMNYKTGEILASVSQPTFDPKYVQEYLNGDRELDESAMVNRVTSGRYTPGSVFKVVTALAAIRYLPGVTERTFTCDGPLAFDEKTGRYLPNVHLALNESGETEGGMQPEGEETEDQAGMLQGYRVVRDYNEEYHGELDLEAAFSKSCNHVFGQLAMEIGADRLARVAKEVGIGEDFLFDDMVTATGSFEKAATDVNLAWSGVGQYTDIETPLHMCLLAASVANDGVMMQPKLLKEVRSGMGAATHQLVPEAERKAMSAAEAQILAGFMAETVKSGTGTRAAVSGVTVAGKTGTAEVSSGEAAPNAWFIGFVEEEEHPLAVCVVLEKGGSGGRNAAPIAARVLKKAIDLGY
ncbi:MAG TPA: penicillin-binding transpeptidase domain-containing protein [Feifaniaceae bacterium]|nr:penicillin-binding transpeptidase domain-containing protein [Feifaniaceae bacterium]